ncbi:hypothetical protein C2E23DRAFT_262746 [Lenzites betulinus]|nr:hypothetical protein C2E23DRAFT_262746 [Lenzites betulinus]
MADVIQNAPIPSLNNTLGAILLGAVFGFMLYGLMAHQAYRYYQTFHTVLWIIVCYEYLIVNFANVANVAKMHWYMKTVFPATALTMLLCQLFYAHRIYQVGPHWRYKLIAGIAVLFMIMHLSWAMVATVKIYLAKDINQFSSSTWLVSIAYGHAVVADVIFAGALVSALRTSHTGFKRTDSVLDTLIKYTVTTGVLTTFFEILVFIFGLVYPDNYIYAAITIPGVKLYSNSMLAMLNCRQALSDRMMQDVDTSTFMVNVNPGLQPRTMSHGIVFAKSSQNTQAIATSFSSVVEISPTSDWSAEGKETPRSRDEEKAI